MLFLKKQKKTQKTKFLVQFCHLYANILISCLYSDRIYSNSNAYVRHKYMCSLMLHLIHPYTSSRNTRRSTPKLKFLHTPTFDRRVHKSIKHFSNSFSHYAPVLWNSLPFQIRNSPSVASFRKNLKTHLFNSSFPS